MANNFCTRLKGLLHVDNLVPEVSFPRLAKRKICNVTKKGKRTQKAVRSNAKTQQNNINTKVKIWPITPNEKQIQQLNICQCKAIGQHRLSSTKQNEVLTENIQVILADDRHQLVLNDLFGFHVVFFLIHFSCAVDLTTAFTFKKSRFSLPIPGRIFQQLNTTEIHFLCLFFHFCCTSLETIAKLTLESNGVNFNVDVYHFIYLRNFQKKKPSVHPTITDSY